MGMFNTKYNVDKGTVLEQNRVEAKSDMNGCVLHTLLLLLNMTFSHPHFYYCFYKNLYMGCSNTNTCILKIFFIFLSFFSQSQRQKIKS